MASAPPFQVEDQTDEDFFDKLVDDDDDIGEFKPAVPAENGSDSDDVKAFANLNISEEKGEGEAVHGDLYSALLGGNVEESRRSLPLSDSFAFDSGFEPDGVVLGTSTVGTLASSDSFVFDGVIESNGVDTGTKEVVSDSAIGNSSESAGMGIKEVQWAAFNADSEEHASNGFGSYSDFFSELGGGAVVPLGKVEDNFGTQSKIGSSNEEVKTTHGDNKYGYAQYQENVKANDAGIGQSGDELGISHSQYLENQGYEASIGQTADGQDLSSSQSLEDLYPGWKYDPNTGQWYQVDGCDAANNIQGSFDSKSSDNWAVSDGNSQVSYLQQTAQSVSGTITESGMKENIANWNQLSHGNVTTESVTYWGQASPETGGAESVSSWNQVSQGNNGYPAHMVFDPQYPDWYYDTIAQEWKSLETYISSVQSPSRSQGLPIQNGFASTGTFSHENDQRSYVDYGQVNPSNGTFTHGNEQKSYVDYGQVNNHQPQGFGAQSQESKWTGPSTNYNQPGLNMWQQSANIGKSEAPVNFSGKQQWENDHSSSYSIGNHVSQQNAFEPRATVPFYDNKATQSSTQGFVPSWNFSQQLNQPSMHQYEQMHVSKDYSGNESIITGSQHQFQTAHQPSFDSNGGRSSAGRPPHALVNFGFGGKLIVMKDCSLSASSYGSQGPLGGSISVLNVMEVVTEKTDSSSRGGALEYFNTLSRQSFPGPLVGGNVNGKELNKWIDERIAICKSPEVDFRKGEILQLLLSLLKISYQYYGKLRSPFGSDSASKESDVPEAAIARLFTSAKRNSEQFCDYGALAHCLQKLPSEGQMQATAAEVQTLLVSGRKKEALHCATEGKLWGPALVLAAQLGDQFYIDTVKQMAICQLVSGSPLRTLCLLIAGQPADVFSAGMTSDSSIYGAANMSLQPSQGGINSMLDNWEENLAVITANRTKDDELVLIHLGDCLWKDRSEIIAAHICYLVAEATFEPYSDSARLCLIGADHLKFPRTYASPDAIQRTELYEYSKLLGNAQFVLLPFQPYKIIYAHMLAEVGKVPESLKYCQAVLKSLKTGRLPEVDMWRKLVSALEERIRTHQQGGYSTNSAPAKLVGKLLNLFDNTAHRVVGGLPPPVPSTSHGGAQTNEHYQTMGPRVSTSQSTMAMSSLMPAESMEPISDWTAGGTRMTMHNRSVSEPDFGRTPRQVDSSTEASSSAQGKASVSRFGRFSFGTQLLQKTVGFVLKPRQDKQAKLGEQNKFYYDEKLKRWVEEGVEAPAEEVALPPPPTVPEFRNGMSDSNFRSASKFDGPSNNGNLEYKNTSPLQHSSGIPPIPSASNQFSARGRTGVRSRYVDTFNKGGGNPTNLFQSPSVPSVRPASGANPNFFVPSPVSSSEQTIETTDNVQDTTATSENAPIPVPASNNTFHSPVPPTSMTMQRFPSMDNILNNGTVTNSTHSRRTASWSGGLNNDYSPPQRTEVKPLGEVLGMQPLSSGPIEPSLAHLPRNGGSFGDDLHEVEL